MKRHLRLLAPVLLTALAGGCADLELTNPNEQTTETFWQTEQDALLGINAAYRGLQENGAYGRWLQFAYDMRSDIGHSRSPWGELANFTATVFTTYDFEVNRQIWNHHYGAILRANQVIDNVPGIDMNAALRDRIVGEAKFIRALMYFNLVTLYGNVPLNLKTSVASDRPAQVPPEQAWAQIEKDLNEAIAVLPATYGAGDVGRATRGAARALLGRAHLQQREWAAAAAAFQQVIASGQYSLVADYRSNFTEAGDNNAESIFEVQFGGPEVLASGSRGQNIVKLLGPCAPNGPAFCDGDVTDWYASQFGETTTGGAADPRLDATIFFRGTAYTRPYSDYFGSAEGRRFWIKYGEFYKNGQDWDNPVNVKVMRLGGILLLHAEASLMAGQAGPALTSVNAVRQRAGLAPLGAVTLEVIEREQLRELGFENERWLFLARHGWLTDPARIAILAAHDPQFTGWKPTQALLPIPNTEVDLNPNVTQNPGW
ncbi:MAG TPA: RagB/SusD family nutrient uptake outer membrane protein [Longimicrobium sp.]|nr:RagB/SusD family nutrient uptake outer membrane protein [Longimicrobium sp.]